MCKNGLHDTVAEIVYPINEIADSVADTVDPSPICGESAESNSVTFDNFTDAKLTQAFGASILWSNGGSLLIHGALGEFVHALCQADSMTYLVEL